MTQTELDRAVALATGESVATIQRLGFLIADPLDVRHDPDRAIVCDRGPQVVDWDAYDLRRNTRWF